MIGRRLLPAVVLRTLACGDRSGGASSGDLLEVTVLVGMRPVSGLTDAFATH